MIAAHPAFVRYSSQPARSGQNTQQRQLRQTDRRRAVVYENDFITSECQLVTASSRCSIAGSEKLQSGMRACIFDPIPGLIREDRKSTRLNSSHSSISYAVF